MKIHKLNSRKCNSIDWSEQTGKSGFDYSGPMAVIKSVTGIDFDAGEDWGTQMPSVTIGYLDPEVLDLIEDDLNFASRENPAVTPWQFMDKSDLKYLNKYFSGWDIDTGGHEPMYYHLKGKDGKSYFVADIIPEYAWKKFISKVPKYAKYKIEEFTPGYASNSRLHKLNSRKINSLPFGKKGTGLEYYSSIDDLKKDIKDIEGIESTKGRLEKFQIEKLAWLYSMVSSYYEDQVNS